MAEQQTVSSKMQAGTGGNEPTPRDTIKGWNDRRKSNNQVISTLTPFVQLIGLFDEEEYKRMFHMASTDRTGILFDDGTKKTDSYDQKYAVNQNLFREMQEQIKDRLINIYIIKNADHGLNVAPINGVMMAEAVSQGAPVRGPGVDPSGGIGINSLDVDYGKTSTLGSRKFNVRMTINDPAILDERFEYSKLATMGTQFLILYGWANPDAVPGYDAAMSPPKLEIDPHDSSINNNGQRRQRMIVPLRNLGNGGYWSAARVNITNYDFGFNEMGKLEINITLMDEAVKGMASTTLSSIARKLKFFLGGGLDRHITTAGGKEFTLKEALHARQQELIDLYNRKEGDKDKITYEELTSMWEEAEAALADGRYLQLGVGEAASSQGTESYHTEDSVKKANAERNVPVEGYPEATTLDTHKPITVTVPDDDATENGEPIQSSGDENDELADENAVAVGGVLTKQMKSYEKTPAYYFLGGILDSMTLCMATTQGGLSNSRVPSFFYRDISPDSKLSTLFQKKINSVNRQAGGMEERIQEAVIRLKERFLPPPPVSHDAPHGPHLARLKDAYYDPSKGNASLGWFTGLVLPSNVDGFRTKPPAAAVSSVRPVYAGIQTSHKTRVINAIFVSPPKIGQQVGAPMRGHLKSVNTNDKQYSEALSKKGLSPAGTLWCFIPDWKQEINFDLEGNEILSTGSPDGFDPLNPTEYRAAPTKAWTVADRDLTLEQRQQDPYGRGGRFYMIMSFKDNSQRKVAILDYDTFRLSSRKTWNLLQRKWHNLYREYLAAYFENRIRTRVAGVEMSGMPIESIYNEALDLDWLTGKIYNNTYWAGGESGNFLKPWSEVAGSYESDFDLDTEAKKIDDKIALYQEIITENTQIIEGKGESAGFDPNVTAYRAASAVEYHGVRGAATQLVDKINKIKLELEQLTGGRYERNAEDQIVTTDMLDNIVMLRYKNFDKVVASETEFDNKPQIFGRDPETGRPIASQIAVYKAEIQYEYKARAPEVKEEWILWSEYNVPTNNFQHEFDIETRAWKDQSNKAERWKQENSYAYDTAVKSRVEADKQIVRGKLRTITQYQRELNELYSTYIQSENAIDNADEQITQLQARLESFKEFFNDEGKLELSIYDDTSAFDGDGIKVPMGRAQPMHLTTKVAQQWARRFSATTVAGAMDVRNYGPPQGGKEYVLPTNIYTFRFSAARRSWQIIGTPKRVLDPAIFLRNADLSPDAIQNLASRMLSDLSFGIKANDVPSEVLSKNMDYGKVHFGRVTEKGYQNWSLFGSPGVPNDFGNNEWGFTYGPPIERVLADGNIEMSGGNYVRTYKGFLDLFGRIYNADWPDTLKITGSWPMPRGNGDDAKLLKENTSTGLAIYTLVDDAGNIIVPDGNGWYRPSGWYLDFAGEPVFLYPSRTTACKINDTDKYVDGVRPGGVIEKGITQGRGFKSRERGNEKDMGDRQKAPKEAGESRGATWEKGYRRRTDDDGGYNGRGGNLLQRTADFLASGMGVLNRIEMDPAARAQGRQGVGTKALGYGINEALKKYSDGVPEDYLGTKPSWGGRIGLGEHCLNLTLDMKRSMIINRNTTSKETRYLGQDVADGGRFGPENSKINWNVLKKEGNYYYLTQDYDGMRAGNYAIYDNYETTGAVEEVRVDRIVTEDGEVIQEGTVVQEAKPGVRRPAKNARVIGPKVSGNRPYSNSKYPYGTGMYKAGSKAHGPFVFPEKSKNWVDWSDLLLGLGPENGYGFFTQVDNSNYTPCVVQPNGSITDGLEINEGFVKFIIENVYAPLPKNRRCGSTPDHTRIKILGKREGGEVKNYHQKERINDVTYQDLFGPLLAPDEEDTAKAEPGLAPSSFGNLDNFKIDNVKNIPIRREVVDNLFNKNNTNMSVIQAIGELTRPEACGINSGGNQHIAIRQGDDSDFEVSLPGAQNIQKQVDDMAHLWVPGISDEDILRKRFPEDIIMLDFKAGDSLIESLDMNSTFDPLVARAFKDAAADFTGTTDALINFMGFKDVAKELIPYLETESEALQPKEDGAAKAISIDDMGVVTLNKELFIKEGESRAVIQTAVTKYLQANPQKVQAMRAITLAAQSSGEGVDSSNYASQLLSNYMKKTTITIHGTTNLSPLQKIIIKGIMPDLEGMYMITSTRESITPQGFQTIIEGVLAGIPSQDASAKAKELGKFPVESEQDPAKQPDPPPKTVEEASELAPTGLEAIFPGLRDESGVFGTYMHHLESANEPDAAVEFASENPGHKWAVLKEGDPELDRRRAESDDGWSP